MNIIALIVAAAAAFGSASAVAQSGDFAAFVDRTNAAAPPPSVDSIAEPALEGLRNLARAEGRCVPTALALEPPQNAVATFVIAQAVVAGQIKNGWTAYGRPAGCPASPPVRFLVLRMADDSLRAFVVNEGESLANPSLMRDASVPAAVAAFSVVRGSNPTCNPSDMRMGPTRVAERTGLGPNYHGAFYAGSWREIWTFTVCGRTVEVPIVFTADGEGGAHFNARGTEARILD